MTETLEAEMPKGYEQIGRGKFPPFFELKEVGQNLEAEVVEIRQVKRTEKARVKGKLEEIEKVKMYFDLKLLKNATGADASRQHNKVSYPAGKVVTLSPSGSLVRAFGLAALKKEGRKEDEWPTDGTEPKINWSALHGLKVYIQRKPDGKMSKDSAFPGNKVIQYAVGFQGL